MYSLRIPCLEIYVKIKDTVQAYSFHVSKWPKYVALSCELIIFIKAFLYLSAGSLFLLLNLFHNSECESQCEILSAASD